MPEPGGGQGGHWPPQYLADQLTLFEPGRADYSHLLLLALSMFFTFRHHCTWPNRKVTAMDTKPRWLCRPFVSKILTFTINLTLNSRLQIDDDFVNFYGLLRKLELKNCKVVWNTLPNSVHTLIILISCSQTCQDACAMLLAEGTILVPVQNRNSNE